MAVGEDVIVKIGLDSKGVSQGLAQTSSKIQNWANGIERMAQGPRSALYGLMHMNPFTSLLGSIALLGGAIVTATMKFSSFLNGIKKQSDALDITTDAYQRFQYAANRSNVGMDKVETFLTRFTSKLEEARDGSKNAVQLFDRLGLSISELSKKTPDQAFNTLLKRIAQLKQEGKDVSKIVENLFGRRSMIDVGKLIADNGFVNDQAGAPVASEASIKQAEALQNQWEKLKQTFVAFLDAIASGTKIFEALNTEIEAFTIWLKEFKFFKEEPEKLGKQEESQWVDDLRTAIHAVEGSSINGRTIADLQRERKAIEPILNIAKEQGLTRTMNENGQMETVEHLEKRYNRIEEFIDAVSKLGTNNEHIKQVLHDEDIRQGIKDYFFGGMEDTSVFGQERYVREKFRDRIIPYAEAQQQKQEASIAENMKNSPLYNQEHIFKRLNDQYDEIAGKAEIERQLRMAAIEEDEREIQILKKLNELRQAGVEISEEEFRQRLKNPVENPTTELEKWFKNANYEVQENVDAKANEEYAKKLREESKARSELLKKLEHDTHGLNEFQKAVMEATEEAEKMGMNQQQTEGYQNFAESDAMIKWLRGNNIEGFNQDIYANELAKRGGFASSVTTWEKSSNEKILDWLKSINKAEDSRNADLKTLISLLSQ